MAYRFPPLPSPSDLVRLYKLSARKHLSQNFLLDMNLCHKIVKASGNLKGAYVCEVGPGPGGITRAILSRNVEKLSVIELDKRFLPSLKILEKISEGKLDIHMGDVLRFDMEQLFPDSAKMAWDDVPPKIHIIGNLPFNVSTPLIIRWIEHMDNKTGAWKFGRAKLTLTFQLEVAKRIVADINTEDRCRLSIMCQNWCDIQQRFVINGSGFVPPPKVDAAVVRFVPKVKPEISLPFKLIEKVVRCTFQYRQKKCRRGVQDLFPRTMPELVDEMFMVAGIDQSTQCFKLGIKEIGRLCHVYNHICKKYPFIYDYNYRDKSSVEETEMKRLQYVKSLKKIPVDVDEKDSPQIDPELVTDSFHSDSRAVENAESSQSKFKTELEDTSTLSDDQASSGDPMSTGVDSSQNQLQAESTNESVLSSDPASTGVDSSKNQLQTELKDESVVRRDLNSTDNNRRKLKDFFTHF